MSKRADALNELRGMSREELDEHLRQQRHQLFVIRFQQATGQVENHRQIRHIHKQIARAMTVQLESQLEAPRARKG